MCYDAKASLYAWIVNLISSAILLKFSAPLAVFFMYAGLMQAFDLAFWLTQDKSQDQVRINAALTKIAAVVLHLQPVVALLCVKFLPKYGPVGLQPIATAIGPSTLLLVAAYCAFAVPYMVQTLPKLTTIRPNVYGPGLYWEWNFFKGSDVVYTLFVTSIVANLLENFRFPANLLLAFLGLATLIMGSAYAKSRAAGRFWCYFGAYIPAVLALYAFWLR
jgi:hypothetical protein